MAALLQPSLARAEPEDQARGANGANVPNVKGACVEAYESSQVSRKNGELLKAHEALRACAREECPVLVRTDCANWLEDLEEALPSIVVRATVDGVERNDVAVSVDGELVKSGLDGKAIAIDPGPHHLHYETPGFPPLDATVVVREGEHFRPVAAAFESPRAETPTPPPTIRPIPLSAWIFAGASVVATGSFVGWAVAGKDRRDTLERQCAPFCATSDVDGVRQRYLAADISLAAAVASLGLASFFYVTRARVALKVGAAASGLGLGTGVAVAGEF